MRHFILYMQPTTAEMWAKDTNATILGFLPDELSTTRAYKWDTAKYSSRPPVFFVNEPVFTKANWGDQ